MYQRIHVFNHKHTHTHISGLKTTFTHHTMYMLLKTELHLIKFTKFYQK